MWKLNGSGVCKYHYIKNLNKINTFRKIKNINVHAGVNHGCFQKFLDINTINPRLQNSQGRIKKTWANHRLLLLFLYNVITISPKRVYFTVSDALNGSVWLMLWLAGQFQKKLDRIIATPYIRIEFLNWSVTLQEANQFLNICSFENICQNSRAK